MAGVSRLQYTTESRLIRTMCSGRVDLEFIFRAFSNGMDGVFIGGCLLNECNYVTHGNYHALNMVLLAKKIMERIGMNPERLNISFMSSGEGNVYAEVMTEFGKTVKEMGPLGDGEGLDKDILKAKIQEVRKLVPYIKIVAKEKLRVHLKNPAEYDAFFTSEEIDALFRDVVSYYIDPEKCQACTICAKRCPVEAIDGAPKKIHIVDQEKCIKCGTCLEACPAKFGAVTKISRQPVPPPVPEDKRTVVRKGTEKDAG